MKITKEFLDELDLGPWLSKDIEKQVKQDIVTHSKVNYKLEKEIAYAKWKIEQFEDKPEYAEQEMQWSYCLATLQQIEGTHSHDAEYDDKFEEIWNDES